MADDRMWLKNRITGEQVLLAKFWQSRGWEVFHPDLAEKVQAILENGWPPDPVGDDHPWQIEYELADKIAAGWVSTGTALPADGSWVLGAGKHLGGHTQSPGIEVVRYEGGGVWFDSGAEICRPPTHWMPLPAPPTEDRERYIHTAFFAGDVRDLPHSPGIGQRFVGNKPDGTRIYAPVLPCYEAFVAPANFPVQFIDRDGQKMRVVRINGILYKERV